MKMTTAQDIGLTIRRRRQELGLGQQALADRVGVSRQWIVEIEQGKPRAEVGLLLRTLASIALQISITPQEPAGNVLTEKPGSSLGRDRDVDINAVIERAQRRRT
ncbi:MAG: helix-turn-helix domain-containing protein [Rhodospirillales bacterium]|nr:helix-turn-helix domain-containing protein [Rhodospirillales bacterium]